MEQNLWPDSGSILPPGALLCSCAVSGSIACKDRTIKLLDYGARWYDPYLNRFISPDTIVPNTENPQSWNRYMYVSGNPLKYVDPTGHMVVPCRTLGGEPRPKPTGQVWRVSDTKEQAAAVTPTPSPAPTSTPTPIIPSATPTPAFRTPTPSASTSLSTPTPVPTPSSPPPENGGRPSPTPGPIVTFAAREPDYRGVSVDVGVPFLVKVGGYGLSQAGLPEVGLPMLITGIVLDANPITGPIGVGGAVEWDNYGHHYISGQVSWGQTWPAVPVGVSYYGVRIFTEGNRTATESEVMDFVPGPSVNVGVSTLYGFSLIWNPAFGEDFPGTSGIQSGWAFPLQAGGSLGWSFQVD
jgi:RHS repeat-associated protein